MVKLHNTLSRKIEDFVPINKEKILLYTCGPTVYNFQHIGNMRTFLFEDILKRVLLFNGYNVHHVMNITDVGHLTSDEDEGADKMELSAKTQGKSVYEIAEHYTQIFYEDIKRLNIIPADVYSKATEYIKEQIEMIVCLEEKGYSYVTSDGVYFDTAKFPDYTKLAKLDVKGMQEGARIEFSNEKKSITDFALWKFSPKDEQRQMEWESPWGKGFPGWHIECSAMAKKLLGTHIDIHCGGIDHIPVHHTNEIAQSEACNGEKFVNYWVHGDFLLMEATRDNEEEKMSKSKGEFITVQTLIDKGYKPEHYRYFLLNAHYRKKLKFSYAGLDSAKNGYENLKGRIVRLKEEAGSSADEASPAKGSVSIDHRGKFLNAINDDLNVTQALAVLWDMLKDNMLSAKEKLEHAYEFDKVLGLDIADMKEDENTGNVPAEVVELAQKRKEAKAAKDFKLADSLRQEIKDKGYEVADTKDGFEIKAL